MALKEQDVLAYLQQHADFLHTHARTLGIRPNEAKVLSFNQGSLVALKQKTERMAAQLAHMLADAEQNRATAAQLLAFNQKLLSANTLGQLWQAASASLAHDFGLPLHGLAILASPANRAHVPVVADATQNQALQQAWAKLAAPQCGTRLPEAARVLLSAKASVAESFLQLPVWYRGTLLAVLVVGHEDAAYFHADLETDLVRSMADSLAVAIARMMGLSA